MKHNSTITLTKASQISFPVSAQRALGVKPGDRMELVVGDAEVTIRRRRYQLEEVLGSLDHPRTDDPQDFDQIITDTQSAHFEKRAKQLRTA